MDAHEIRAYFRPKDFYFRIIGPCEGICNKKSEQAFRRGMISPGDTARGACCSDTDHCFGAAETDMGQAAKDIPKCGKRFQGSSARRLRRLARWAERLAVTR